MATAVEEMFSDDELLKSLEALDAELLQKGVGESASDGSTGMSDDEEQDDSGDSDSSSEDETLERGLRGGVEVNRASGPGAVEHVKGHTAVDKKGKHGHSATHGEGNIEHAKGKLSKGAGGLPVVDAAAPLKVPGGQKINKMAKKSEAETSSSDDESVNRGMAYEDGSDNTSSVKAGHKKPHGLAKSFSDVATPEAEQSLDVTPFLAAQAEVLDSLSATVNSLAKSLDGFGSNDELLAKSIVDLGRGMIDTRRQLAEVFESINDIRKGLRMPVRQAPKSALSKSEAVERFEANEAPSLNKSQTAGIITDLVIKGLVDPMAVSAYEATGWMDQTTERAVQAEVTARFSRRA